MSFPKLFLHLLKKQKMNENVFILIAVFKSLIDKTDKLQSVIGFYFLISMGNGPENIYYFRNNILNILPPISHENLNF